MQPAHAACLPPPVAQAASCSGKRAAARKGTFRAVAVGRRGCRSGMDRRPSECTFRALAAAHLRCSSRASRSPHGRRSLPRQRGCARPPPAATAVPRPCLPAHGTPAVPGRTSPQQAAMGGAAATMATFSGPTRSYTMASERPARRRASLRGQAAPAPGARMSADIGAGAAADPQPESRRAVRFAGKSGLRMAAGT